LAIRFGRTALLLLVLTAAACKGKHSRVTVQNDEQDTEPRLASIVRMNDAKSSAQLLHGFYGIENNSWRWTAGKFSVLLRTPLAAAQRGATLSLAFNIPDGVIQRLQKITLSASVNGMPLTPASYDKPGTNIYTADIPPSLLAGESVSVDFALDKTVPPDVDKRELGIVATSVGLSSK
jgi:hypothetical protein